MSRDGGSLLLDTHVWVCYVENEAGRFSRGIDPLVEAVVQRGEVVDAVRDTA